MVGLMMLTGRAMPCWDILWTSICTHRSASSSTLLVAMDIPRAVACHVVISISMLTANFRSRWVTANSGRYEYAKLAQRRPALPQS